MDELIVDSNKASSDINVNTVGSLCFVWQEKSQCLPLIHDDQTDNAVRTLSIFRLSNPVASTYFPSIHQINRVKCYVKLKRIY